MKDLFLDMTHGEDVIRATKGCPTLKARMGTGGNQIPLVIGAYWDGSDTTETLTVKNADGSQRMPDKQQFNCVLTQPEEHENLVVRRLTINECERLQGFPDDWTKIPWKGKGADKCPYTPRYKAIGNAWAIPVVRWIGERMVKEMKNEE